MPILAGKNKKDLLLIQNIFIFRPYKFVFVFNSTDECCVFFSNIHVRNSLYNNKYTS